MFFYYKKVVAIIVSFFYILANHSFYNSIFNEYTNDKLFKISTWLGVIEVIFWIMLFYSVFYLENKDIKFDDKKEIAEKEVKKDIRDLIICFSIFIISLICVDISRVILQSSPYINDTVSTVNSYVWLVGGTRVLFIFSSIVFGVIAVSRRNIFLIIVSVINFIVSIMIWLDFDGNVTAIMRIVIAILAIIYYLLLKDNNDSHYKEKVTK